MHGCGYLHWNEEKLLQDGGQFLPEVGVGIWTCKVKTVCEEQDMFTCGSFGRIGSHKNYNHVIVCKANSAIQGAGGMC